MNFLSPVRKFR